MGLTIPQLIAVANPTPPKPSPEITTAEEYAAALAAGRME